MLIANRSFVAEVEPLRQPRKLFRYRIYELCTEAMVYEGFSVDAAEARSLAEAHLERLTELQAAA